MVCPSSELLIKLVIFIFILGSNSISVVWWWCCAVGRAVAPQVLPPVGSGGDPELGEVPVGLFSRT